MLPNILCLIVCLALVAWRYTKSYEQGLLWTVFLIVVLPESISLHIAPGFPVLTFHRLATLLTIFYWSRQPNIRRSTKGSPFRTTIVLIVACFFVSTLLSAYILVSVKRFLYYFMEFFVFFCVIQTSANDERIRKGIVAAIGSGLLTVAVLGIIERYFGIKIENIFPYGAAGYSVDRFSWAADNPGAITVSYRHRILFGMACAIGTLKFVIDAALLSDRRLARRRLLYAFVCASSLYFSNSRGPWLSFIFGSLVLVVVRPSRFLKPAIILAAIAILVMIVRPGVWASIRGLGSSTMNEDSVRGASFQWRLQIMDFAFHEIISSDVPHLLFGYGGGSTIMTDFGKIRISSGELLPLQSWDCELAVNLYERGAIGLLLIIGLFYGGFIRIFWFLRKHPEAQSPVLAFVCAGLAVIVFMMSNVAIYAIQLVYIEVFLLAISSRLIQNFQEGTLLETQDYEGST